MPVPGKNYDLEQYFSLESGVGGILSNICLKGRRQVVKTLGFGPSIGGSNPPAPEALVHF